MGLCGQGSRVGTQAPFQSHPTQEEEEEVTIQYGGLGPPEFVEGEKLASALQHFRTTWLAARPRGEYIGNRDDGGWGVREEHHTEYTPKAEAVYAMGPVQFLSDRTGIHERRIGGMFRAEFPRVSFEEAEALLIAANLEWKLYNDEIPVERNPKWSQERWAEYMAERGCY